METIVNFIVGLLFLIGVLIVVGITFLLWPFLMGVGSFLLLVTFVIIVIIFGFYAVTLIGKIIRKGLK